MSKKRDKRRARLRKRWEKEKRELLTRVREKIGLASDEHIPDAVLLREVDGYIPTSGRDPDYRLEPREQWFGFRLLGLGSSESERRALADRVQAGYSGTIRWGMGPTRAGRRSPAAGRRRNLARRSA